MPNRFASGKRAIGECDRCGFQYPLKKLRALTIKLRTTNTLVCPTCWEADHPQLQLGLFPVDDPQAVRNPRPDNSYWQSGMTGLQIKVHGEVADSNVLAFGTPADGSRDIQWGWNPVGMNDPLGLSGLPNTLLAVGAVGTVTVQTEEN